MSYPGISTSDAVMKGIQQLLLNAAGAVSALTSLHPFLSGREVKLDSTPLRNLGSLEDLSLSVPVRTAAAAMNTVKRLPMLQSLRIQTFNQHDFPSACTPILRSLCSSPTPTKLATLWVDWLVTAEHMSILAQLPSLTELIAQIELAAAPQLPLLTHLKKLNFFFGYTQPTDPFLSVIPHLQQLTDLTLFQ